MTGVLIRKKNLDTGRYEQREDHVKMEDYSKRSTNQRTP